MAFLCVCVGGGGLPSKKNWYRSLASVASGCLMITYCEYIHFNSYIFIFIFIWGGGAGGGLMQVHYYPKDYTFGYLQNIYVQKSYCLSVLGSMGPTELQSNPPPPPPLCLLCCKCLIMRADPPNQSPVCTEKPSEPTGEFPTFTEKSSVLVIPHTRAKSPR